MENPGATFDKKAMKSLFKTKYREKDPNKTRALDLATATALLMEVSTALNVNKTEEEAQEFLSKVDMEGNGVFNKKECKMALKMMLGQKQYDETRMQAKKAKYMAKLEKKRLKREAKMAKMKAEAPA